MVIYLLWTNPASGIASRHRRHKDSKADHQNSHSQQRNSISLEIDDGVVHVRDQQYASHWKGVWVPNRSIQVMSVIEDIHHEPETKIVLPAFLKHSSNRQFYCCFHLNDDLREFVQVPARLDYIDLRYLAELQAAAFECRVKLSEIKDAHRIKYVSFASESCLHSPTLPMTVTTPERRKFEFAVCTKVAYDYLDPAKLLEWFTFMELMGASKILTFYNNVQNATMTVLKYFEKTGLLELIEFNPRNRDGVSVKYTAQNGQTRQAQHDKTLAVRDCQYRLAGYDFVMTIDFDEFPVPLRPFGSINWVLETLMRNNTDAAAFLLQPVLLPPDWRSHKDQTLYHWQYTRGVTIRPYCNKWVYAPAHTWMASTHNVIPKEGYRTYDTPKEYLHLLHFRACKPEWYNLNCSSLSQKQALNDDSLQRFADRMLNKLRKLPLEELVPLASSGFASLVRKDPRGRSKSLDTSLLFDT
ncbi:glycosyltransferase-like protein [Elysia marginata]|uniref:Glycosyltransferase family 92 protein n=1 Tax=Elysia marginata TaxID=1093978 RepID=A0AAV4I830_9GAST|nr:glycosyltransferase-like protein [Elysia marginata]